MNLITTKDSLLTISVFWNILSKDVFPKGVTPYTPVTGRSLSSCPHDTSSPTLQTHRLVRLEHLEAMLVVTCVPFFDLFRECRRDADIAVGSDQGSVCPL